MSADVLPLPKGPLNGRLQWVQCNARWIVLATLGLVIGSVFWFGSRYPALLAKANRTSNPLASMAYSHEAFSTGPGSSILIRIALGSLNWLSSMAIGMTFGLSFGALLHTALRYYPLRIGQNLTLNTLKGALVGVPMGVCANCAVPMACGLTRGQGSVEVALGYLFSSPNFNPVVVAITFSILPWYFGAVKYAVLLFVILFFVPRLIQFLENKGSLRPSNGQSLIECLRSRFLDSALHPLVRRFGSGRSSANLGKICGCFSNPLSRSCSWPVFLLLLCWFLFPGTRYSASWALAACSLLPSSESSCRSYCAGRHVRRRIKPNRHQRWLLHDAPHDPRHVQYRSSRIPLARSLTDSFDRAVGLFFIIEQARAFSSPC